MQNVIDHNRSRRRESSLSSVTNGDAAPAVSNAGARGDLTAYVGYGLRRAQIATFQHFIRTLAEVDLRPAQFSVLALIDANPGIMPTRAGAAMGIKKANFVPLAAELEGRGVIRRVARDGRSHGLFLTAKGKRLLTRARELHDAHHDAVVRKIGEPEYKRLLSLLGRIVELEGEDVPTTKKGAARRSLSKSKAAPRRGSATRRNHEATDPA